MTKIEHIGRDYLKIISLLLIFFVAGCSAEPESDELVFDDTPYTISGTISGLKAGASLTIQNTNTTFSVSFISVY